MLNLLVSSLFGGLRGTLAAWLCDTVKGLSEDGHSYAGTVVRGVLRGLSE